MTTVFLTSASTSPFSTPSDFGVTAPSGPSSLTHFDGTNGSTSFPDATGNIVWTRTGSSPPVLDTSQSKFGSASLLVNGPSGGALGGLSGNNSSITQFGTGDFTIDFWVRFTSL